jgi:cell fate (sporulation/competence/biofilm development) regulator YlbF (YheA/YmcA/DUF963 family)
MLASTEDALLLLQKIVELEDIVAQYKAAQESMRQRLTELEQHANKLSSTSVAQTSGT